MELSDFDFELPEQQIAQHPAPERDASRLLVLDRRTGDRAHRMFRELPSLLREGDLLVLNDTRVIAARLMGRKAGTGGRAELLLVRPSAAVDAGAALRGETSAVEWVCLGQASKGLKQGARIELSGGVEAEVLEALGGGEVRVRFQTRSASGPSDARSGDASGGSTEAGSALPGASAVANASASANASGSERVTLGEWLERAGRLPLPPYIDREPTAEDEARYQTVFARTPGSVAAPTASLHFTDATLKALEDRGVQRAFVTLDVGPGTFMPVRDSIDGHVMHLERYRVPEETADLVARTRARHGRVVAVGTTVVRTLESATDESTGRVRPGAGETRLFIKPGFRFRQVDALLTNFHLPKSTLLMLVSAFAGYEHTLSSYREAVTAGYRFFSYGDAMFISDDAP